MKRHKMIETLKKIGAASAAVCLAALFFIMLAVSGHTAPENPMEDKDADASRMYLTSSTLAMDETQLADVENANINTGEEGHKEAQEEKEKEQEEDQAEQGEMQQEDDNAQENQREQVNANTSDPSLSTPSRDSLLALIDKHKNNDPSNPSQGGEGPGGGEGDHGNQGGGEPGGNGSNPTEGGKVITLNPEESSNLFETNLKNGRVDEPKYDLKITLTEKGKKLKLLSRKVTRNGSSFLYPKDKGISLEQGHNKVSVTLCFRDPKTNDQIYASTEVYNIIYTPKDHFSLTVQVLGTNDIVYLKNGDDYTVYNKNISLRVTVSKGTKQYKEYLRKIPSDGDDLTPSDSSGRYDLKLNVGPNKYRARGGDGQNQEVCEFTITYKTEIDTLQLISKDKIIDEKAESPNFGGRKEVDYKSKSDELEFLVTLSNGNDQITRVDVENRLGSTALHEQISPGEYMSYKLDAAGPTSIKVTFKDSQGMEQFYIWDIKYEPDRSESENNDKAPFIKTNLGSEKVDRSPWQFEAAFYAHDGRKLSARYAQVYLNGEELIFSGIAGEFFVYDLYLTEGPNYLSVTVTDDEQYTITEQYTVTFSPDKESVQVRLILSANVIGLGTKIDEYVTVPGGQTIAQIVNDRLEAYGYTPIYEGTPTDAAYFLNYIDKPGILDGWSISDEQREMYELQGITIEEPASNDSLGKDVFASGSAGWMVTQNNGFIGKSMGVYGVRDGDVIQVMFTINNGEDINVDPNSGAY